MKSLGFLAGSAVLLAMGALAQQPKPTREIIFGRDVMPILGQRCFRCHGPDAATVAAGLRLDSLDGAKEAISVGHPEKSLLIKRVSAADPADRMPPANSGVKPLSPEQIETLKLWIAQGAKFEKHWAFIPPAMPPEPKLKDTKWAKNIVDKFVLAKLEKEGLKPEPEADKETLARRASEVLTGLPPTQKDVLLFLNDKSPTAYEAYVDRLLAKPTYGEHQAKYWLDAIRYADTHGLQLDNERGIFPYRDWVIRAFNQDLPFDQFTTWQLAGDLLPNPTTEQLIATGYVRANLTSNEGGAIEEEFLARNTFDRVETTSTVFLGMTVGCARCHDHKYDPIKQSDYYGLYAFFNSTADRALDGNETFPPPVMKAPTPTQSENLASLNTKLREALEKVDISSAVKHFEAREVVVPQTKDWQISPVYARSSFDEAFDAAEAPEKPGTIAWKPVKLEIGKDLTGIINKPSASVYVKGVITYPKAVKVNFGVSSDDGVKIWLNGKLIHSHKIGRGLTMGVDEVVGEFKTGDNEMLIKVVNVTNPDGLNLRLVDANEIRIDSALREYHDKKNALPLAAAFLELGPKSAESGRYATLVKMKSALEAAIPQTLIAKELDKPRQAYILRRGEYLQKGVPVARHIPAALGGLPANEPKNRLGLAHWLTSPKNPLTTRVFVNRVWQQAFGMPLIKTAEDFGTQGEWPMNQALLDALTVTFRNGGLSMKKLNRLIVTSAAFRQSSVISKAKLAKDPENRLISRGPRFRLDSEAIRDKALYSAGILNPVMGGRGFKPYQPDGIWEGASDPASATHFYVRDKDDSIYKRSIYMFWKRTAPPPMMITMDSPLRDTCVVRRSTTNTPLQALTTLNETAFLECARVMAERVMLADPSDTKRLSTAVYLAFGRAAKPQETKILTDALKEYKATYAKSPGEAAKMLKVGDKPQNPKLNPADQAAWMIICSTLMNTDEFLTVH